MLISVVPAFDEEAYPGPTLAEKFLESDGGRRQYTTRRAHVWKLRPLSQTESRLRGEVKPG
jgi:hypothetical protein